jgi:hypothetical protein
MTVSNLSGTKENVNIAFTWTDLGGQWFIQGGSGNTTLAGMPSALPTTGSCLDGTATGFTIIGTMTYVDIT